MSLRWLRTQDRCSAARFELIQVTAARTKLHCLLLLDHRSRTGMVPVKQFELIQERQGVTGIVSSFLDVVALTVVARQRRAFQGTVHHPEQ
jgi:hypothetical protein